jgi:hypothetical protein
MAELSFKAIRPGLSEISFSGLPRSETCHLKNLASRSEMGLAFPEIVEFDD